MWYKPGHGVSPKKVRSRPRKTKKRLAKKAAMLKERQAKKGGKGKRKK